jgi:hypothetical protein
VIANPANKEESKMNRDDLPEDLEQDLLPPYDELQRWYSGFVYLRHTHGYSEKWVRSVFKSKFGVWPRGPLWTARRGNCPDEMREIGIYPTAKIMRFAFKNRAAFFEAKFADPNSDPAERKWASFQAESAQELLLEIPPEADKLADESWARFPQFAADYDEALRAFQSAQKLLRWLSAESDTYPPSRGSDGGIGDDDIPL